MPQFDKLAAAARDRLASWKAPDGELSVICRALDTLVQTQKGVAARPTPDLATLARSIDYTLLTAGATAADVERLCREARRHGLSRVCVNSVHVATARAALAGSEVAVASIAAFPLGAMITRAKAFEARLAVEAGATEVDAVVDLGALRGGDYGRVLADLAEVVRAAAPARVKAILEMSALNQEQKVVAVLLAERAGVAFVKTSTGFGSGGATVEDVALMRRLVGDQMGVKASGGIRTRADAERLFCAGADRLGTSAALTIIGADSHD